MKELIRMKNIIFGLFVYSLVCVSCGSEGSLYDGDGDDDGGTPPSEEDVSSVIRGMSTAWGAAKDDVLRDASGFTVVSGGGSDADGNGEEIVRLRARNARVSLAYKFYGGKLCASVVMLKANDDFRVKTVLPDYEYTGETAGHDIYTSSSRNTCAISYQTENEGVTYQVIGWQPFLAVEQTVGGVPCADLGLSVRWATYNAGASSPMDAGGYYAWGETEEKDVYRWSTYKYCDGNASSVHSIGDDISGTQYDVSVSTHGSAFSMPTRKEMAELTGKCTWVWTTDNNTVGYKVFGGNGNYIFLPAVGYKNNGKVSSVGTSASYATSTADDSDDRLAYKLNFTSTKRSVETTLKYGSACIRPVVR